MKKFYSLIFAIFIGYSSHIFAQLRVDSPSDLLPWAKQGSDVSITILPGIIAYIIGITAVLAIIAITWAGIQMFLSVGNEEKFTQARNILIFALVGVGLAGGAYLIVNLISNIRLT